MKAAACSSCDVQVRDMKDPTVAADAKRHGINRLPAVAIDGKLSDCGAIDIDTLRSMGLGSP